MKALTEMIIGGSAILFAALLAYLTGPALQSVLVPQSPALWTSGLSRGEGIGVLFGLFVLAALIGLTTHLRNVRARGTPLLPAEVWALLITAIAVLSICGIAVVAFGMATSAFTTLGATSMVAGFLGAACALTVMIVLQ